jgi:hypothetical protein
MSIALLLIAAPYIVSATSLLFPPTHLTECFSDCIALYTLLYTIFGLTTAMSLGLNISSAFSFVFFASRSHYGSYDRRQPWPILWNIFAISILIAGIFEYDVSLRIDYFRFAISCEPEALRATALDRLEFLSAALMGGVIGWLPFEGDRQNRYVYISAYLLAMH